MVLSLTLCAAFAFAQTKQIVVNSNDQMAAVSKAGQADYKASIFTKDDEVIGSWEFEAANAGYTVTRPTANVTIDGVLYKASGQGKSYAIWNRFSSPMDAALLNEANYPVSYDYGEDWWLHYMDTTVSSSMNGFMMMSMQDQIEDWGGSGDAGVFHSYIQFESIPTSGYDIIDVRLFQYYRCFNSDKCFIDYSTDNGTTWHAFEINKKNVDVNSNESLWGFRTITMPTALANQANLTLRIRWYCENAAGGAYGYIWALDDVEVIAGSANRMKLSAQTYLEGGYQILPQSFSLPVTWYSKATNNGLIDQNNVDVKLYSQKPSDPAYSQLARTVNGNITPDPVNPVVIATDGIGWMPFSYDSIDYAGWYGYSELYNTENVRNRNHGLPTSEEGWSSVYASVKTDSIAERRFDTIPYLVNALDEDGIAVWGRDNGILTIYQQFTEGYSAETDADGNTEYYLTNEGEWFNAGYGVNVRFTVGDSVPENWVLRGVELVPSATPGAATAGKVISAEVYQDYYEGNSVYFMGVNTGATPYTVQAEDLNDSTTIADAGGYLEYGDYNTVRIMFPEQPALEPFAQYRIGYVLENAGFFSVANMETSYYSVRNESNTKDSAVYFSDFPELEKYTHSFTGSNVAVGTGSYYDLYVSDKNTGFYGSAESTPMIRLLVGPEQEVERVAIHGECQTDEDGELMGTIQWYGDTICGTSAMVAMGSAPSISIYPTDNYKIVSVSVDGEEVEPYDEEEETGDPALTVYDRSEQWKNPAMTYTFQNPVQEEHTISATFEWAPVSIDPVAANVHMTLNPNPATSQVRLNIEGVEGMVDCSIIDMSGRVVYSQKLNAENAQVINLSNMAKGAYFVRIVNNEFSKVEKLIVR